MSKLLSGVTVLLTVAVIFLTVKVFQVEKQVEAILKKQKEITLTPSNPATTVIDPSNPFENDQKDPMKPISPATDFGITTMRFDRMSHNFGRIKDGEVPETVFKIKNTGKNPLLISSAVGSCGCTVPSFPKAPIPPGEEAEMRVTFDSKGKTGEQTKTVTVRTNTEPPVTELQIKATVIPNN